MTLSIPPLSPSTNFGRSCLNKRQKTKQTRGKKNHASSYRPSWIPSNHRPRATASNIRRSGSVRLQHSSLPLKNTIDDLLSVEIRGEYFIWKRVQIYNFDTVWAHIYGSPLFFFKSSGWAMPWPQPIKSRWFIVDSYHAPILRSSPYSCRPFSPFSFDNIIIISDPLVGADGDWELYITMFQQERRPSSSGTKHGKDFFVIGTRPINVGVLYSWNGKKKKTIKIQKKEESIACLFGRDVMESGANPNKDCSKQDVSIIRAERRSTQQREHFARANRTKWRRTLKERFFRKKGPFCRHDAV